MDTVILPMRVPPVKLVEASKAFLPAYARYYTFLGVVSASVEQGTLEGTIPVQVYGYIGDIDKVAMIRKAR